MIVAHAGQQIGELGQLVVMRREQGFRARPGLQLLDHRPGDGEAVESGRAAADFVEQHQAVRRAGVENRGRLGHLDHKRRAAARQVVGGADACKNSVEQAQLGALGGHVASHLRHQGDECRLPQISGLAPHIRPRDDQDLIARGVHVEVVGHESPAILGAEALDDRMAPFHDDHFAVLGKFRAAVIALGGELGKRCQDVELGERPRRLADASRLAKPGYST